MEGLRLARSMRGIVGFLYLISWVLFMWMWYMCSLCKNSPICTFRICSSFWWRRKWLPTLVFLAAELHWQRSLAGYSLWGRKESNATENDLASLSCVMSRTLKSLEFTLVASLPWFGDTGRRHGTLGSETREPMPHSVVSRMSHACFPTSELHRGSSDGCCTGNGLVSTEEPWA